MADPIDRALEEGRRRLTEAEGKEVLEAAGVPVPDYQVVADAEAAVEAAETVGYPVVVKVSSPAVEHKSEWADGAGVTLGNGDPDAVRAAARDVLAAGEETGTDVEVLVEAEADRPGATELIVGGTRTDSFGPTVLLGVGGVLAEVLEDTTHRLAPLTESEVRDALGELAGSDLLAGHRNRSPADLDALAAAVVDIGDLLVDREAIREVDVNPLLAGPDRALALDALVVLAEP